MHVSRPIIVVLALGVAAPAAWFLLRARSGGPVESAVSQPVKSRVETRDTITQTKAAVALPAIEATKVGAAVVSEAAAQSRADEMRQLLTRNGARTGAELAELRTLLASVARELSGAERADVLSDFGVLLARRNPGWTHDLLSQLGEFRDRHGLVRAVVEQVMTEDPLRAAAWVAELSEPALRDSAYNVVGMKWAETNVPRALEWAMGLPEGASRVSAFEGLTWTWAQKDASATYEWAIRLAEVDLRDQMFVKLAKMIAVQDPKRALAWALQFPPGAGRDEALHYAVFQWAADDLKGAAEWTAQVGDKRAQSGIEVAIARSWSNQEAQGATAWAAEIRDPQARDAALKTTLRKWAEVNPAAAAQWLGGREATPANEAIFLSVTSVLIESRPAVTKAWLEAIANPEWRATGAQIVGSAPLATPAKSGVLPKG